MKKYFPLIILFVGCTMFFSCKKSNPAFESLSRLEGSWSMTMGEDGAVVESWTKINDTLYEGKSYEVTKGDSVLSETVQLIARGNDIFS